MVAPPLVANVYQLTTFGTLNDMPCDHVTNWLITGSVETPSLIAEAIATADTQQFMPNFATWLPTWYTHTVSRCIYLGDLTSAPATVDIGSPGTSTDTFGSHNSCWTVRHHVNVRGKGKQGRTNFPGPSIPAISQPSGQINAQHLGFYATAWSNYYSGMLSSINTQTSGTGQLVVLDRKLGTYNIPTPGTVDPYPNTHRRWQKRLSRHR